MLSTPPLIGQSASRGACARIDSAAPSRQVTVKSPPPIHSVCFAVSCVRGFVSSELLNKIGSHLARGDLVLERVRIEAVEAAVRGLGLRVHEEGQRRAL